MPESSGVGFTCLGNPGSDPALEVLSLCHLAFRVLARDPPAIPSEAVDQDERPETGSPFAFLVGPSWGRSMKVWRGPRRSRSSFDSLLAVKQADRKASTLRELACNIGVACRH